jgi:hypothetical protein
MHMGDGMRYLISRALCFAVTIVLLCSLASALQAGVIWNESVNGSFSTSQGTPTVLTLSAGTNSIVGTLGPGDSQDFVTLTVPAGLELTNLVNSAYSSTDVQGFTGFALGTSITGSAFTSGSYNGWSHFGTGANNSNGITFPAFNSIGDDLLPIMQSQSVPQGAAGFTLPLAGGQSYSFLIQQLGGTPTSYQFDYVVTPVPEPSTLDLLLAGATVFGWRYIRLGRSVRS